MHYPNIILGLVAALTVLSAGAAVLLAATGTARRNPMQRDVADMLMKIALLGAGALVALLDRLP